MLLKRVGGGGQPAPNPAEPPAAPSAPGPPSGNPYSQNMQNAYSQSPVMPTAVPGPNSSPAIPGQGLPSVLVDKTKLRDFRNQIVTRIQSSIGPNTVLTR